MYWEFVIAGYTVVGVGLAAYAVGLIRAGRALSQQVPPERRRFLD
jgi:hypothetical protein